MRDATRDLHVSLDASSPLSSPGLTAEAYLAYAARMLGWMRPVERNLYATGLQWPAGLHSEVRAGKSQWLAEDLKNPGDVPECPYAPRPENLASAYGLAYVCEGATLGGAFLYKRLSPALSPMPLRWLQGYGAQTGPLWKGFLARLAEDVHSAEAIASAAQAAREGFVTLQRWLEQPQ